MPVVARPAAGLNEQPVDSGNHVTAPLAATARSGRRQSRGGPIGVHASMTLYPDGSVRGAMFGDCAPVA